MNSQNLIVLRKNRFFFLETTAMSPMDILTALGKAPLAGLREEVAEYNETHKRIGDRGPATSKEVLDRLDTLIAELQTLRSEIQELDGRA